MLLLTVFHSRNHATQVHGQSCVARTSARRSKFFSDPDSLSFEFVSSRDRPRAHLSFEFEAAHCSCSLLAC
jgi:hypothetical protein